MKLRWLIRPEGDAVLQYSDQDGLGWRDVEVTHVMAPAIINDIKPKPGRTEELLTQGELARQRGYTGDVCIQCGMFTMKRNGPCLVCETCGQTTGCS